MIAIPYLLALTFAALYLRTRSRLSRCRKVAAGLSVANRELIAASEQQARLYSILHREMREMRGATKNFGGGIGGESRIVEAFNDINRQPVRMFGSAYTEDEA